VLYCFQPFGYHHFRLVGALNDLFSRFTSLASSGNRARVDKHSPCANPKESVKHVDVLRLPNAKSCPRSGADLAQLIDLEAVGESADLSTHPSGKAPATLKNCSRAESLRIIFREIVRIQPALSPVHIPRDFSTAPFDWLIGAEASAIFTLKCRATRHCLAPCMFWKRHTVG